MPSSANEPKIEFSRIRPKLLQHTFHSTPVLPPLARLPGVPPGRERGLSFLNRSGAHFHFSARRAARAGPLQGGTAHQFRSPSPASPPNPRKFVLSRATGAKQPFGADFSRNFAGVSVTTRGCTSRLPASAAARGVRFGGLAGTQASSVYSSGWAPPALFSVSGHCSHTLDCHDAPRRQKRAPDSPAPATLLFLPDKTGKRAPIPSTIASRTDSPRALPGRAGRSSHRDTGVETRYCTNYQ